jgi:sensor histidine kinase YesM
LSLSAIKVPPLILQPFVENAVLHGLMHKHGKGTIKIFIQAIDEFLVYAIEDNGIGREKSLEIQLKRNSGKKSRGMEVTSNRLKLLSHNNTNKSSVKIVDLKTESNEAAGTRVIIRLPITHTENGASRDNENANSAD